MLAHLQGKTRPLLQCALAAVGFFRRLKAWRFKNFPIFQSPITSSLSGHHNSIFEVGSPGMKCFTLTVALNNFRLLSMSKKFSKTKTKKSYDWKSSKKLLKEARRRDFERAEKFKDHLHTVKIRCLDVTIVIAAFCAWNPLAPENWHWPNADQLATIQSVVEILAALKGVLIRL